MGYLTPGIAECSEVPTLVVIDNTPVLRTAWSFEVAAVSQLRGGDYVTTVIKCDKALQVQCDMKYLLQLYPCAFALLAARSAFGIENLADVPCGLQWRRQARIIGGESANPGEFPWLVSITNRGGHFCGGTIINKRWVMTAAHCMCSGPVELPVEHIRVNVGKHNLNKRETPIAQEIRVRRLILHPDYQCDRYMHDLALLELDDNVDWSKSVWPACLPQAEDPSFVGKEATAAGWGWIQPDVTGKRADILQKVTLLVVDNDTCRNWYKSEGKKTKIADSQICAGYEQGGRDTCWADSGGPLMVGDENRITVVGVVSTGIGCARPKLPGLYTRLTNYSSWIRNQVLES
ncbi:hypothetical protein L9F63_005112 [Diploptera punctata]|uniref:Peptidase S1 domain-containing protein n=1 Tax=Diploptera punctata TaxID=6984 RepID=A0AAD8E6Q7_DIPPU|nr:hypothetical protein L9F63_005112 [Diploptera punctata]